MPREYRRAENQGDLLNYQPASLPAEIENNPETERLRARLVMIGLCFLLAFSIVSIRLVYIAFTSTGEEEMVAAPSITETVLQRGKIYDRNGLLLASNLSTQSLFANPKEILHAKEAVDALTKLFPDISKRKLEDDLAGEANFVWVKRYLTPNEAQTVNSLGIPGLYLKEEWRRAYPYREMFAHVLGYVDTDNRGLSGLERGYEKSLLNNNDMTLTLDARVQEVVHREVAQTMKDFKAIGAAAIVADVRTGEILSLVSLPDFDPHFPGAAQKTAWFNRATLGVYELGSVLKSFTIAKALDRGVTNMGAVYDVREPIKSGRFVIRDYHPENRPLTMPEVFMHSSNIGTAKIALDLGKEDQEDFYEKLGFDQPVKMELPERGKPIFPQNWSQTTLITASYGHGISISPMHLVRATAAMVNGGALPTMSFIKKENYDTGPKVISKRTSDLMRKLMRLVVTDGTGKFANISGFMVGGKTGSAEKITATGRYDTKKQISSFVSAFPMDEPHYLVFVMFDEPQGNAKSAFFATGGWTAAPAVGRIIQQIAPILGVTSRDEDSPTLHRSFDIPKPQQAKTEPTTHAAL